MIFVNIQLCKLVGPQGGIPYNKDWIYQFKCKIVFTFQTPLIKLIITILNVFHYLISQKSIIKYCNFKYCENVISDLHFGTNLNFVFQVSLYWWIPLHAVRTQFYLIYHLPLQCHATSVGFIHSIQCGYDLIFSYRLDKLNLGKKNSSYGW